MIVGQTKKTTRPVKTTTTSAQPVATPTPSPAKKNDRPQGGADPATGKLPKTVDGKLYSPTYFYEFTRPGFDVGHMTIEHDAAGKGKITFTKRDFGDAVTDPIELSLATVTAINDMLAKLDYFNSSESYQYEKDMPQMGDKEFRFVRDGRERKVKFNWTANLQAKRLMDTYANIGYEYVWRFDLVTVRENQPLRSPAMMDELDGYLQRNEIADPPHLIPLLTSLSTDERLPLIARNHASRMITFIQKIKK